MKFFQVNFFTPQCVRCTVYIRAQSQQEVVGKFYRQWAGSVIATIKEQA